MEENNLEITAKAGDASSGKIIISRNGEIKEYPTVVFSEKQSEILFETLKKISNKNYKSSNLKISLYTKEDHNHKKISYRREEIDFIFDYTNFEKQKRKEISHRIWNHLSDYLINIEHVHPKSENALFSKEYTSLNKEITVKRKLFKPILNLIVIRDTHYFPKDKNGKELDGVEISKPLNVELLDEFLRCGRTY
ncbi:MAG: hypothetical protein WC812_02435 [Candidatus Pacearchaeota archaeon]|jgi:hypothetical protein